MDNFLQEWDGKGNFRNKILRISTVKNPPLSNVLQMDDGVFYNGTGVAFEIVKLLEKSLNFSHRVLPLSKNNLEPLISGKADFAAAFLAVPQQFKPEGVIYSTSLATEEWLILMKRPEESATETGLLAPFHTYVWLATLCTLITMGPVIYLLLVLRGLIFHKLRRVEFSLSACYWFTYSAIMKQGSTLSPKSDISRLLFSTWWIFITILTSFYTANLTAFLTLSRFTLPIEDPKELSGGNIKWIGRSNGALEHAIMKAEELSYLKGSLETGLGRLLDLTDHEILDLVMRGYVFLGERTSIEWMVFHHYQQATKKGLDHAGRCTLVYTNKPFMVRSLAFAFPANSSLPLYFNPILSSLREGGVLRHSIKSEIPNREICPLNLGNSERQLRNSDLLATYYAMLLGLFFSIIAFTIECLYHNKNKKQKKHVNIKIKINNKKDLLFYPHDFTTGLNKSAMLMDPHLFIVQRALNVRITKIKPKFTYIN